MTNTEGEVWRRQRHFATPVFHFGALPKLVSLIELHAKEHVREWHRDVRALVTPVESPHHAPTPAFELEMHQRISKLTLASWRKQEFDRTPFPLNSNPKICSRSRMGCFVPPVTSRFGSLLLAASANVRSSNDASAFSRPSFTKRLQEFPTKKTSPTPTPPSEP